MPARSNQVAPGRLNLLTHFPGFSGPRPDPTGPDLARHFGSHFGSPQVPIYVRHPDTSKPPTAFPLAGGPSSVSTQSAPEGIRTPNLLIRRHARGPNRRESRCLVPTSTMAFPQVKCLVAAQVGFGRIVTFSTPEPNFGANFGAHARPSRRQFAGCQGSRSIAVLTALIITGRSRWTVLRTIAGSTSS